MCLYIHVHVCRFVPWNVYKLCLLILKNLLLTNFAMYISSIMQICYHNILMFPSKTAFHALIYSNNRGHHSVASSVLCIYVKAAIRPTTMSTPRFIDRINSNPALLTWVIRVIVITRHWFCVVKLWSSLFTLNACMYKVCQTLYHAQYANILTWTGV